MNDYEKKKVAIRYWMIGKEYFSALEAMELASKYHCGFRKDGITHEFSHQVEIASFVRTLLPSLMFPEDTISTVFFHDLFEDYHISKEELRSHGFNDRVVNAVGCMTKKFRGQKEDLETLFGKMAEDPIASIAKGADRVHNLKTMQGVFTKEKQLQYVDDVHEYFFPMLKKARRNFPLQEMAYENIKHCLQIQVELITAMHGGESV